MKKIIAILGLCAASFSFSVALGQSAAPPKLRSFEFLGCSGDWDGKQVKPEVWRIMGDDQVTFLTHQVATCGLSGQDPVVSGNGIDLDLSYQLVSPSEAVVLCDCEYWARFTFGPEASGIRAVTVGKEPTELRGSWPGR